MKQVEDTALAATDIDDIALPRMTRRARRAYLQVALDRFLQQPLSVHRRLGSVCVVAFGLIAFVNRCGMLSVARHDRGVLSDMDTAPDDCVEELPVRPTAQGVRTIATLAIVQEAARALGEWAGEPIDLRSLDQSDWTDFAGTADGANNLWAEATAAVDAIPAGKWRSIAVAIPRLLGLDFGLVRASRWSALGGMSAMDAYQHARALDVQRVAADKAVPRALVAHCLAVTYERRRLRRLPDLEAVARWLRGKLREGGVTPRGWRLLLDSPLPYWRCAFRRFGYDLDFTTLSLLIGQQLSPPRLPKPAFTWLVHEILWQADLAGRVRNIPPQVWRTLVAQFESAPADRKEYLADLLPWAAAVGLRMPASLRQAGFRTLEQHAIAHLLDHGEPALGTPRFSHRYEEHEGYAQELAGEEAVCLVGRMMGNCLPTLWPEIEAGRMRVFFAVWREQRIVIGLRPNPAGAGWNVDQLEGRRRRRVRKEGRAFAERLCQSL